VDEANERVLVRVTSEPLDPADALAWVANAASGGTCVFVGTVRDHSDSGGVTGLTYEAWEEEAAKRMREVADEMLDKWPVRRAALLHRIGELAIGDAAVVVACSAPHRAEAFEACRHGIERTKGDVPIWKKEALTSGDSHWVRGS
jgi:molybdopterin synthase catalytic subunit